MIGKKISRGLSDALDYWTIIEKYYNLRVRVESLQEERCKIYKCYNWSVWSSSVLETRHDYQNLWIIRCWVKEILLFSGICCLGYCHNNIIIKFDCCSPTAPSVSFQLSFSHSAMLFLIPLLFVHFIYYQIIFCDRVNFGCITCTKIDGSYAILYQCTKVVVVVIICLRYSSPM